MSKLHTILNMLKSSVEYPKIYTAAGIMVDGITDTSIKGRGFATVILNANGIAQIEYEYKIITGPNKNIRVWDWGLNRNLLHSINNNIPLITPITGGHCLVYNNDNIDYDKQGMGGTSISTSGIYWIPGRNYTDNNDIGAWESSLFSTNFHVIGTAYGTFEV